MASKFYARIGSVCVKCAHAVEKHIFGSCETSFMAGTDQSVLSHRDPSHVLHLKMPGRKMCRAGKCQQAFSVCLRGCLWVYFYHSEDQQGD